MDLHQADDVVVQPGPASGAVAHQEPATRPRWRPRILPPAAPAPPTASPQRPPRREALAALGIYAVVSLLFFGVRVAPDLGGRYLGRSADPGTFIWFLAWWPHAIAHGMNPFLSHVVWAPSGVNLAWATSVPGAGLAMAPITALAGPVVAYNLAALAAPALAGWGAFLLCRQVTRSFWPSVAGGYLFAFSSYEIGQMGAGHLNLTLVFALPLAAYLVLRRLDGRLGPRAFVWLLAAVLTAQFLLSVEVFLSLSLFGFLAIGLGLIFVPNVRRRLLGAARLVLLAFALSAAAASPYLIFIGVGYGAEAHGRSIVSAAAERTYSADLANFVVPTVMTAIGHHEVGDVSTDFTGDRFEHGAYLGLPLLAVVVAFAVTRWRQRGARVLLAFAGLAALASLGPWLHVGGPTHIRLPWGLVAGVPFLQDALPGRFVVYVALAVAVMAALWLATGRARPLRWIVIGLAAVALLPNLSSDMWVTPVREPAFFATDAYRRYLAPAEIAMVLPFGHEGDSMLWQTLDGFDYRMAEGYVATGTPRAYRRWSGLMQMIKAGRGTRNYAPELRAFLSANDVRVIVVAPGERFRRDVAFLAPLRLRGRRVDGAMVYAVPAVRR